MLSAKDDCFTWNNRTKDIREVLFHVKHLSASGGTPIILFSSVGDSEIAAN